MTKIDFPSTGRFRVLIFTTTDILDANGTSSSALNHVCSGMLPTFPTGTVELVVLHPFLKRRFEWTDIPSCVKENAEIRFHGPEEDSLYGTYGVHPDTGAAAVVRPDGYVGAVCSLSKVSEIDDYLSRCLVKAA
jgi:phenol 2-monooxygenase